MLSSLRSFAAAAAWLLAQAASSPAETLVFGVVPQQSASRLARDWTPLLEHLSATTGLELVFATAKDIPTFEACLGRGAYDVAYMNPYHYTVFHQRSGYVAFARQAEKKLKGVLVVRKDSPADGLESLNGVHIAFPAPAAFGASVLPQAEMAKRGLVFSPRYLKSHESVYRAVAAGLLPAGGGVARTLRNAPVEIRDQLRVLYTTAAYTPHAFAASPSVAPETAALLTEAMLKAGGEAPELLRAAGFTAFQAAADKDWDDVRALGLKASETDITVEGASTCRSD